MHTANPLLPHLLNSSVPNSVCSVESLTSIPASRRPGPKPSGRTMAPGHTGNIKTGTLGSWLCGCLPAPSGLPRLRCPDTCQPSPGGDPTLADRACPRDDIMASWPGRALWGDGQPVVAGGRESRLQRRREGMGQALSQLRSSCFPRLSAGPASEQPEGQEPGRSGSLCERDF